MSYVRKLDGLPLDKHLFGDKDFGETHQQLRCCSMIIGILTARDWNIVEVGARMFHTKLVL